MNLLRPSLLAAIATVIVLAATPAHTQTATYKSQSTATATAPNKRMTIIFQNGASLAIDFTSGTLEDLPSRVRTGSGSAIMEFSYATQTPNRSGSIVINLREVTAVTIETP